jgi:hypothetical protein
MKNMSDYVNSGELNRDCDILDKAKEFIKKAEYDLCYDPLELDRYISEPNYNGSYNETFEHIFHLKGKDKSQYLSIIENMIKELDNKVDEPVIVEPPKEKIKIDREKSKYLFSEEEVKAIEKDLNTSNNNPYTNIPSCEGIDENLDKYGLSSITEENYKELNEVMLARAEKDTRSDDMRLKNAEKIKDINKQLANQEGLSKLWAINEKFDIDPEAGITEEEAFKKAIKEEEEITNYRKADENKNKPYIIGQYKHISKELFPIVCPLCDGMKNIKLGFFKIKCFKCKHTGKIEVKSAEYREIVNKNPEAAWKEEIVVREKDRPKIIYKEVQEKLDEKIEKVKSYKESYKI